MHIEYDSIKTFISTLDTADSWVKREFPQYAIADAKNKGKIGEKIFFNLCLENGKDIIWNNNNDDHDFILNGYFKVELKFSLASNQRSTGEAISRQEEARRSTWIGYCQYAVENGWTRTKW